MLIKHSRVESRKSRIENLMGLIFLTIGCIALISLTLSPILAGSIAPTYVFTDNFSSYPSSTCFTDGSRFGPWLSVFQGDGCTSIQSVNSILNLSLKPITSTSIFDTNSALVAGPIFSGNIQFETQLYTAQQLRIGSLPNTWEVGWVIWNYTDDSHFYYFIPKPNGWELGKEDPAYPGGQRFLTTGSTPTFPIQQWYSIKIVQKSNTIWVYSNNSLVTKFTDNETPYTSGAVGFYAEDSQAYYNSVKVSSP